MVESKLDVRGYIHSVESFGAVDGPGIRYVVFFQGCPLRCKYCHNPDTWERNAGKETSVGELIAEIRKYKNFLRTGGVTLSGGEPTMQPEFLEALLTACHDEGFHTVIDTVGVLPLSVTAPSIDAADMLLLDLKCIDTDIAKDLTGQGNENMLRTLDYCEEKRKPIWIRQVLLDGYTLNLEHAHRIGELLKNYTCIEKVDLLPFHQMAAYKWAELGIPYSLEDTKEPEPEKVQAFKDILLSYGLPF